MCLKLFQLFFVLFFFAFREKKNRNLHLKKNENQHRVLYWTRFTMNLIQIHLHKITFLLILIHL